MAIYTVQTVTHLGPTEGSGRMLARESGGRLWCCYSRLIDSYYQVCCAYSDDDGENWTEEQVTTESAHQYYSTIAIDSQDNLHLVWVGRGWGDYTTKNQLQYRERTSEGWQAQEAVTNVNAHQGTPALAVDSDDNLHLVWFGMEWGDYTDKYQIQYRERTSGGWQAQEAVTNIDDHQYSPCIAVDSSGYLHVAWHGDSWPETGVHSIQYRKRTDTWQSQEEICQIDGKDQARPDIALDPDDYPHVTWFGRGHGDHIGVDQILYRYKTSGGWQAIELVTNTAFMSQECASIVRTSEGDIWICWDGHGGTPYDDVTSVWISKRDIPWPSPTQLTSYDFGDRWERGLWANYPEIAGLKTNIPKVGSCFIFSAHPDVGVYEVDFYKTDDLEWQEAAPPVGLENKSANMGSKMVGAGLI